MQKDEQAEFFTSGAFIIFLKHKYLTSDIIPAYKKCKALVRSYLKRKIK